MPWKANVVNSFDVAPSEGSCGLYLCGDRVWIDEADGADDVALCDMAVLYLAGQE